MPDESTPRATIMLLRMREAAEALGVGRSTIYGLVRSGDLPSVRIGRSLRVPAAGLQAWVEGRARRVEEAQP